MDGTEKIDTLKYSKDSLTHQSKEPSIIVILLAPAHAFFITLVNSTSCGHFPKSHPHFASCSSRRRIIIFLDRGGAESKIGSDVRENFGAKFLLQTKSQKSISQKVHFKPIPVFNEQQMSVGEDGEDSETRLYCYNTVSALRMQHEIVRGGRRVPVFLHYPVHAEPQKNPYGSESGHSWC